MFDLTLEAFTSSLLLASGPVRGKSQGQHLGMSSVFCTSAFETTLFQEIYEQIDKNNDGTIVFEEFVTVLDHPKVNLSR